MSVTQTGLKGAARSVCVGWRDMVSQIRDAAELSSQLHGIDGKGYGAYKSISGKYRVGDFILCIDYVQGDPYAAPSKLRVQLDMETAGFPLDIYGNIDRKVGLEDYLLRAFDWFISREVKGHRGSGKSGLIAVDSPGQEVIQRTGVKVSPSRVEVRLVAGLPARGRRVLGYQAEKMLLGELPRVAQGALFYSRLNADNLWRFVLNKENSAELRRELCRRKAVAFVADRAILPRRSGISEEPMSTAQAVPFESPPSLRTEIPLANGGSVSGMLIPEGVTLIVGGGYHGKSTLLDALDRGIYDHVPDDGRERVVTLPQAVKIRAEDGRQVTGVDISFFISDLPNSVDTTAFWTPSASGSTSQAANIMEALEMGAEVLLVDEDTSATNFMVRDMRMQKLVSSDREPITPFIDRVRQLYEEKGVSTVLVVGGSGDYFDVADTVIMMDHYRPVDVTRRARAIAKENPTGRVRESAARLGGVRHRYPDPKSIDPTRKGKVRIRDRGLTTVEFGSENIELDQVEQLVDVSQTRAVGQIIEYARKYLPECSIREALQRVEEDLDEQGLDIISPFSGHPGDFARPRMMEVAAALNRLRSLRLLQGR